MRGREAVPPLTVAGILKRTVPKYGDSLWNSPFVMLYSRIFIPASSEPRGYVYMSIWQLPRGSNTPMSASLLV